MEKNLARCNISLNYDRTCSIIATPWRDICIHIFMYVVRVECTSRVSRTRDVSLPRSAVPGPGPGSLVNPGPLLSAVQLIILRNTTNERCRGITYTLIIWYSVCICNNFIIVVLLSYSVFNFVTVLQYYSVTILPCYGATVLRATHYVFIVLRRGDLKTNNVYNRLY